MREGGGNCLKCLKRGGTKKRKGETEILKRGRKLGQGVGAIKREVGTPLRTMLTLECSFGNISVLSRLKNA